MKLAFAAAEKDGGFGLFFSFGERTRTPQWVPCADNVCRYGAFLSCDCFSDMVDAVEGKNYFKSAGSKDKILKESLTPYGLSKALTRPPSQDFLGRGRWDLPRWHVRHEGLDRCLALPD